MDEIRAGRILIPADEVTLRFSRAGGPGGQNVNRRATRVEATFDVAASSALTPSQRRRAVARLRGRLDARGRVHVVSQAGRTQAENRRRALERLGALLEHALRPPPPPRRPTRPSAGAVERRLREKKARGRRKADRRKPSRDE